MNLISHIRAFLILKFLSYNKNKGIIIMFLQEYFKEKRRRKLGEDFQYLIDNAYKKYVSETHTVYSTVYLHILSEKDVDVDVEELFRTIRSMVIFDNGTMDYTTKSGVSDILYILNPLFYVNAKDERTLVFNRNIKTKIGEENNDNNTKNMIGTFSASKFVSQIKDKEFSPSNLFIYVVEKERIYHGYSFICNFLPEYKEKTLYYKGSINYKESHPYQDYIYFNAPYYRIKKKELDEEIKRKKLEKEMENKKLEEKKKKNK